MPKYACAWNYSFNEKDRETFSLNSFNGPRTHACRYEAAVEFLRKLYYSNPAHIRSCLRDVGIWIVVAEHKKENLWPNGKPKRVHAIHFRWDDEVAADLPEKTLTPTPDGMQYL